MIMARLAAGGALSLCVLACSSAVSAQDARIPVPATAAATPAVEAPTRSSRMFDDLFRPIAGDFKRLPSGQNLLLAGIGGGAAAASHAWDRPMSAVKWGGALDEAFEPGQMVGSFLFQAGAAFITYNVGRATGNERLAGLGAHLVRAQIVAQTTTQALKFATRRTRPDGSALSLPSGHSAAAFATASVLQSDFGWKLGVPAYAAATWVAASRIQMKRHYVSDVVAGATIGIMAGRSVTVGRGAARFALSPMAVPGGLGVSAFRLERR